MSNESNTIKEDEQNFNDCSSTISDDKNNESDNNNPKNYNKEYATNYYKTRKDEKIKCDRCNKDVTKFTLKSHYKSAFCQTIFCMKDTNNYLKEKENKAKNDEAKKIKDEIKALRKKLDLIYNV